MDLSLYVAAVIVADSIVGAIIGRWKQRPIAGFLWGLFLGPIGWLLVALGPDMAQKQAKRCPFCLGLVPMQQSECAHCNRRLIWVRGEPRKPSGAATSISR